MDFVYVCRDGDNEELRYSIRSVIENYESHGNIWVVGGKPDWYTGNFIPNPITNNPYNTTRGHIKAACMSEKISDDFVLMNDDFFIMLKLNSVIDYHGGVLEDRSARHRAAFGRNEYEYLLADTAARLKGQGIRVPLDYDLHIPININKSNMLKIIDQDVSIRSYYGNIYGLGGEQIEDVKTYSDYRMNQKINFDQPYVSTDDMSFKAYYELFKDRFPNKSVYEA
jgi:hypothetical protein